MSKFFYFFRFCPHIVIQPIAWRFDFSPVEILIVFDFKPVRIVVNVIWLILKIQSNGWLLPLFKEKAKSETSSLAKLRFHNNISHKFINNLLAYEESQANPISVHLLSILQSSKHFEQLFLILNFDSNPRI